MSDPVTNGQLELACRLGSVPDVTEALDEGADIDCNGYSPLFFAIQNGDRSVLEVLVARGADTSCFGVSADKGEPVDQLMAMAPAKEKADSADGEAGMAELDAKMIRAFNRMITNKGIAEPILKGRFAEYQSFADALQSLAAEDCQTVVSEFLAKFAPEQEGEVGDDETEAKEESEADGEDKADGENEGEADSEESTDADESSDDGAEAAMAFVKDAKNAELLTEFSERYLKAGEEEQPAELLKDYLKEAKKVAK